MPADEPTIVVDVRGVDEIVALIKKLTKERDGYREKYISVVEKYAACVDRLCELKGY